MKKIIDYLINVLAYFAPLPPFCSDSCFVIGVCLSNYKLYPFLIYQCLIQEVFTSGDILIIGKFWETSER